MTRALLKNVWRFLASSQVRVAGPGSVQTWAGPLGAAPLRNQAGQTPFRGKTPLVSALAQIPSVLLLLKHV